MIVHMVYRDGSREAAISRRDECEWLVWLTTATHGKWVTRRSLTSAQSTAREFLRTGRFPRRGKS